jgi:hypothetical protein
MTKDLTLYLHKICGYSSNYHIYYQNFVDVHLQFDLLGDPSMQIAQE